MLNLYRQKPLERHTQNVSIHCCESWQKLICECSRSFCFFFWTLGGGWVKRENGKLLFCGGVENPKVAFKLVKEQSGEWGRWACYCYIIQCRFTSKLFNPPSCDSWRKRKRKNGNWTQQTEENDEEDTTAGTVVSVELGRWLALNGLGASLSLSLAGFFFFPRGVSKKGNYQLTDQQAGWGGSSLGEEFRGQKVMC